MSNWMNFMSRFRDLIYKPSFSDLPYPRLKFDISFIQVMLNFCLRWQNPDRIPFSLYFMPRFNGQKRLFKLFLATCKLKTKKVQTKLSILNVYVGS